MQYRIEDTFDVSPAYYWETFFSEEFNRELWPYLNIEWSLIRFERRGEGENLVIDREQRLTPRREVPKLIQKFVDGAISYVEKNHLVARDNRVEVETISTFAADKIINKGIYRLEPLGPKQVRRVWDAICECKIPLVGGKIEKYLVDEVKQSYAKTTEFTRRWFAEHPE
jgi:hypothetical protein